MKAYLIQNVSFLRWLLYATIRFRQTFAKTKVYFRPNHSGLSSAVAKCQIESRTLTFQKNCVICLIESPLKMMKNVFYFILKAIFVLQVLKFLSWNWYEHQKNPLLSALIWNYLKHFRILPRVRNCGILIGLCKQFS